MTNKQITIMTNKQITDRLFSLRDEKYAEFQAGLIPGGDNYIGVRTPALKAFAKELYRSDGAGEFLSSLPHDYFDENQLHAFIISLEKDFDKSIALVQSFLPYVDNWATCDQLKPVCFKKNTQALLKYIDIWLGSKHTYTVRFAIGCLMSYFLDDSFDESYMLRIAQIKSDEYYINMMRAWYFATALAKQYNAAVKYIETRSLDAFTHKKTIQKAVESFRVSDEHKAYLKTLKK